MVQGAGKEELVPLSTTRWQHRQGSTQSGLVLPVFPREGGFRRLNLNPEPDFFSLLEAKPRSEEAGPPALLSGCSYTTGS